MCKLSFCLLAAIFACLATASLAAVARDAGIQRDIIVVKNWRDFAAQNPGLKMQRLEIQTEPRANGQSVRYTLGARVSGDRLVAQGADVFNYGENKDVSVQLTYPESGAGSIVTFVELICTQDSSEGNAYVVAGGIGQRLISIVVEAKQTENFAYQSQYYGSD